MKVNIVRFELYPKDEPTGYAVGVNVDCENGRYFYRDTTVAFTEIAKDTSDEDIVKAAYAKMKEGINSEVDRLTKKTSILGSSIVEGDKGDITINDPVIPEQTPADNTVIAPVANTTPVETIVKE